MTSQSPISSQGGEFKYPSISALFAAPCASTACLIPIDMPSRAIEPLARISTPPRPPFASTSLIIDSIAVPPNPAAVLRGFMNRTVSYARVKARKCPWFVAVTHRRTTVCVRARGRDISADDGAGDWTGEGKGHAEMAAGEADAGIIDLDGTV